MNLKKQQIINAAYTLFINKGYNASSIQDILDEAGVSKGLSTTISLRKQSA
nr:TetR/AcrR family transcriptional regulator [Planococcus glaciei]